MDPTTEEPGTLPPAIVSRLRRLDRSQPIVDPRTDRAVLRRLAATSPRGRYRRVRAARVGRCRSVPSPPCC